MKPPTTNKTFVLGLSALLISGLYLTACGGGGDGGSSSPPPPPPPPPPPDTVASVVVAPGALTLLVGQSQQLTAITRDSAGNPLTGREVTWATSEPTILAVSSGGMVEALDVGSATITATSEGQDDDAPVSVVTSFTFSSVVTGGAHSCALTTDGAALCWGRGESGQLGVAPPSTICALDAGNFPCSLVPVAADGGLAFEQLAGGGAHTCGLTSDGTAWCWGDNADGELGDDSFTDRHAPVTVATALKFASIDAGARHTCALTSDGEAYCWGSNSRGQLGDGTTTKRSTPVAVVGGHSFQQVIAGGFDIGHTCGVLSSGATYCWGDNERGQLGIGSGGLGSEDLAPHPLPEPVPGNAFVQVSAGLGRHTCGLTEFGATWCWGENSFGALGNGLQIDSPVPVEVSGTIDFLRVVAGGFIGHSCGWTASGVAHCWGENERGQVGDGSTFDRLEPSAVAGDLSFTSLDAGFRHTCGSASSGATYCWGSGAAGQLGTNSTLMNEVPMAVQDPP